MTTIAIWVNKEEAQTRVWVAGDSKISDSANTSLIESVPKIFSIPLRCLAPGPEGFFSDPVLDTTIGFAYAGNALAALTFSGALASCLGQLIAPTSRPARFDDVAKFAARLLEKYIRQLGGVIADRARCEVALTGYCHVDQQFKIYHLCPQVYAGDLTVKLSIYSDRDDDDFVLLLGADKQRLSERIAALRFTIEKDIRWWRVPHDVIRNEVKRPSNPTIGGHLQMGTGTQSGFKLLAAARFDHVSYLGINVTSEFGHIGDCVIGFPAYPD